MTTVSVPVQLICFYILGQASTRPSVHQHNRNRILFLREESQKVNSQVFNCGSKLRELVDMAFVSSPTSIRSAYTLDTKTSLQM